MDEFELRCPCAPVGRDLRIRVSFSNHCYTCRFDPAVHVPSDIDIYEQNRVGRVFDPLRYELSKSLPAILSDLPDRKVNQTRERRNYVYVTTVFVPVACQEADDRAPASYQAFFSLRRAPKDAIHDLHLTVESAYASAGPLMLAKRPSSIRFKVLAYKVLRGERVTFAPR